MIKDVLYIINWVHKGWCDCNTKLNFTAVVKPSEKNKQTNEYLSFTSASFLGDRPSFFFYCSFTTLERKNNNNRRYVQHDCYSTIPRNRRYFHKLNIYEILNPFNVLNAPYPLRYIVRRITLLFETSIKINQTCGNGEANNL